MFKLNLHTSASFFSTRSSAWKSQILCPEMYFHWVEEFRHSNYIKWVVKILQLANKSPATTGSWDWFPSEHYFSKLRGRGGVWGEGIHVCKKYLLLFHSYSLCFWIVFCIFCWLHSNLEFRIGEKMVISLSRRLMI